MAFPFLISLPHGRAMTEKGSSNIFELIGQLNGMKGIPECEKEKY